MKSARCWHGTAILRCSRGSNEFVHSPVVNVGTKGTVVWDGCSFGILPTVTHRGRVSE